MGQPVQITEGEYAGRFAVVTEVIYADQQAAFIARSGDASVARYAAVDSYIVRTRDDLNQIVNVKPDEIQVTRHTNFARITPPDQVAEMERSTTERTAGDAQTSAERDETQRLEAHRQAEEDRQAHADRLSSARASRKDQLQEKKESK